MGDIPVVDLSLSIEQVAAALHAALVEAGVAYLSAPALHQSVLTEAFSQSRQFFDQPLEAKLTARSKNRALRGYSAVNTENFSSLIGVKGPNDVVEKVRIGPEHACREGMDRKYSSFYFPNTWPAHSPEYKSTMLALYNEMESLALEVARALAHALSLPPMFFVDKMVNPTSILSCNHYPPMDSSTHKERHRIAPHTDVSLFTIVAQEPFASGDGGLEVFVGGSWVPAPPIPGCVVLNVGDCLSDWSNGQWKSTLHRVAHPSWNPAQRAQQEANECNIAANSYFHTRHDCLDSGQSRHTLVFFVTPDPSCDVTPLGSESHSDSKYTFMDWRKDRVKRAMSALSST